MNLTVEGLENRIVPTAVCEANPTYQAECNYLDHLIPQTAITLTAAQSGNWSDPATWGGRTPTSNDVVYVPNGDTVTVDTTGANALAILNNGVLKFATNANTKLTVDTLVNGTDTNSPGTPQGELDIGTPDAPVQAGFSANLVFAANPNRAAVFGGDYQQLSLGLISMGTLNISGSEVTPYVATTGNLAAGATTFQLAQAPIGWKAGDTLLIAGTNPTSDQTEQIQIASISGTTVTLAAPVRYTHTAMPGSPFVVADEARNVVLQSAPGAAASQQGHVMEMHNDAAYVAYADFLNLGRTDKSKPLNNGSPTTGPGLNQVGRYALHFHRDLWPSINGNDPPILVKGNFESGSPGWGYDNHSSNVDFEDNVGYRNYGAAFVTEAGNEIGTFNGNLAVSNHGLFTAVTNVGNANSGSNSFGVEGEGFWMQSPGCVLTNNISLDNNIGYAFWNLGLNQGPLGTTRFWTQYLADPAEFAGQTTAATQLVPLQGFSDNTAAYGAAGLTLSYNNSQNANLTDSSYVNGFHAYDVTSGIFMNGFTSRVVFQAPVLTGTPGVNTRGIWSSAGYASGVTVNNATVEGFATGFSMPTRDHTVVNGGYWNNRTNFEIAKVAGDVTSNRLIQFQGPITFGPGSVLDYNLDYIPGAQVQTAASFVNPYGINAYFVPDNIILPNGQQLYFPDQAPDAIPFPVGTNSSSVPPQYIGLTSLQLYQQYGLAPGGVLAPAGAVHDPSTNGLIGTPQPVLSYTRIMSPRQAVAGSTYTLQYETETTAGRGAVMTDLQPVVLQPGWNLIVMILDGQKHTFAVFGK